MAATPRVRRLIGDRLRVEHGSLSVENCSHVAVLAHWSDDERVSRSTCTLVSELQSHGYRVVACSASEFVGPLAWDDTVDTSCLTVLRKPNVGYDFGSWSVVLDVIPEIAAAERVLLVNDSTLGPFTALAPVLEKFDATAADVWALTDTDQFGHHLQSYFLGFCGGVLADRTLAAFWANIRHHREKIQIILQNEVALGQLLREEGYTQAAAFSHEHVVERGQNPVIIGWKRLLELGFPFVKREILRTPDVAPMGETMPKVVKQLYGIDVADWAGAHLAAAVLQP